MGVRGTGKHHQLRYAEQRRVDRDVVTRLNVLHGGSEGRDHKTISRGKLTVYATFVHPGGFWFSLRIAADRVTIETVAVHPLSASDSMKEPPKMKSSDLPALPDTAETLALLPMLYVAWADGILTPSEIDYLEERIRGMDGLSDVVKSGVCQHLDPAHPPSAYVYDRWVRMLREQVQVLPPATKRGLADLGMEMAETGGGDLASRPSVHAALIEIENTLGVDGPELVNELHPAWTDGAAPAAGSARVEASGDGTAKRDGGEARTKPPDREPPDRKPPDTAAFDVEALTQWLDGPQHEHNKRLRTLLSDPAFEYPGLLPTPAYRNQVMEWLQLLADQGLGARAFPEAYGGTGDMRDFVSTFESLAMHDHSLVVKFGVQFGLFGGSVYRLGTEKHHERYLRDIATLDLPGCFAMSELGHGSNVRDLETTATYDPDTETFVITTPHDAARKEWIGNAAVHGQMAVVFAQLHTPDAHHGVHAFLVPIRGPSGEAKPSVRIEDCGEKMGLNGVDNGRIWFDDVRVPRDHLLDRFGSVDADGRYESPIPSSGKRFFTMLGTLIGGRISVARAGLMAAKSGLTIAVRYGNRRRQFGPRRRPEVPLLDYRSHQRRLLPRLARTYALHTALQDLTERYAARSVDDDLQDIEAEANALKAYATWHNTDTLQEVREATGGQGYLYENRISTLMADTDIFTTFEGDNTVLLLQVAKGLLSDFQREFRDLNTLGLARFVVRDVLERISETNPLTSHQTGSEHLRSAEFQRSALTFRADRLLQTAAQRLKARIDDDVRPFDAFVQVQDHLLSLAHAHAERLTLDRLVERTSATEDAPPSILDRLRSLFALRAIEEDRGWFLESGVLAASKSKAVRAEVNQLCAEIRPHAESLVDAFGIPDACLAAPIGTGDRH